MLLLLPPPAILDDSLDGVLLMLLPGALFPRVETPPCADPTIKVLPVVFAL